MAYFGGIFFANMGGWGWSELFSKAAIERNNPPMQANKGRFSQVSVRCSQFAVFLSEGFFVKRIWRLRAPDITS